MTVMTVAVVATVVLFAFRVPIAVALGLPAMAAVSVLAEHPAVGPRLAVTTMYHTFTNQPFAVVPLFILMGAFAYEFGLVDDLFDAAQRWWGRFPGGLAIATTFSAAGFAAVTGSSNACCAALARTAMPELIRARYSPGFAGATIAASGTLGILIPPSSILVVYGILTEQSIGALLLAGIIPGIISAVIYAGLIIVLVTLRPGIAPERRVYPFREALRSSVRVSSVLIVIASVLAGIYFGIWTVTEAAAAGVTAVLAVSAARRKFHWRGFINAVGDTVRVSASLFFILVGAFLLGRMLTRTGLIAQASDSITGLGWSPMAILMLVLLFYGVLGMFMEGMSILAITTPFVYPLLTGLGFDGIWLGVIVTKMVEIALISPPVGLNVFTLVAVVPGLRSEEVFRGCVPFLVADVLTLALFILFPSLITVLPRAILP